MLLLVLAEPGCGRKGPPLPPFSHIPDAIAQIQARRVGSDVFITFVVPSQNIDASKPADVDRVEVFAVTTDGPPPREPLAKIAERIASLPVVPPPPQSKDAAPPASRPPGMAAQGESITIRESLGTPQLTPTVKAESQSSSKPDLAAAAESPPAPAGDAGDKPPSQPPAGPRRYYAAVAVNDRNHSIQRGAFASVPVDPLPDAPSGVVLTNTEESLVVTWTPMPGDMAYNVYRDDMEGVEVPAASPVSTQPPAPLNSMPLAGTTFSEPVEFGVRRCFRVRSIRAGAESEASDRQCRTAEDTYPPAAPRELSALTSGDGITLKWTANTEKDLAGYLILRGQPGDATLLPITPKPVMQTTYTDREVKSGARYVYAVVAVDSAPTPNRSPESERDEITAP
jgi:hypothetical protein